MLQLVNQRQTVAAVIQSAAKLRVYRAKYTGQKTQWTHHVEREMRRGKTDNASEMIHQSSLPYPSYKKKKTVLITFCFHMYIHCSELGSCITIPFKTFSHQAQIFVWFYGHLLTPLRNMCAVENSFWTGIDISGLPPVEIHVSPRKPSVSVGVQVKMGEKLISLV